MPSLCCSSPVSEPNYTVCIPDTQIIPDSTIQSNPFYDFDNKKSIWTYTIQVDSDGGDITNVSHWVLQICSTLAKRGEESDFKVEVSEDGGTTFIDITPNIEVLTIDPSTAVSDVLKINRGQPIGTTYIYRITILNPDYFDLAAQAGVIAVKHGAKPVSTNNTEYFNGTTCGAPLLTPSIGCARVVPPPPRGIKLSSL